MGKMSLLYPIDCLYATRIIRYTTSFYVHIRIGVDIRIGDNIFTKFFKHKMF